MLVVDALNQALIPFLPGEDLETWYRHLYHHIRKIKNIGKMLKMNVTFVLDGCLASEETKQKWFDRREKEARSGRRNVPYAVDTFLEEIIPIFLLFICFACFSFFFLAFPVFLVFKKENQEKEEK